MAPLTAHTAHVVDEVLTPIVQDYMPKKFAWMDIFTPVVCRLVDGKVVVEDRSAFVKRDLRRSDDGKVAELETTFSTLDVALEQRSIAGKISRIVQQQSARIPGAMMRRERRVAQTATANLLLQVEIEASEILTDTSNYDDAGVTALADDARWDVAAADPRRFVLEERDAIYLRTGAWPNTLALGHKVITALLLREDIREDARQVRNLAERPLSLGDLSHYFDVEKIVPLRGLFADAASDKKFQLIWGDIAWLGCVDQGESQAAGGGGEVSGMAPVMDDLDTSQTWGAGLRLEGYPYSDPAHYDPMRTSWLYPVHTYDTPHVISKAAAHLWTSVITP